MVIVFVPLPVVPQHSSPGSDRRAIESDWRRKGDDNLVVGAARALAQPAFYSARASQRQINIIGTRAAMRFP